MKTKFTCLILLCLLQLSYGQQGKLDPTFNTIDDGLLGDGFDGMVRTLILQPNTRLLVGGNFNNFNGTAISKFARLDEQGQLDTTFDSGTGFNGDVYSSGLLSNSQIIVGGNFTKYNEISVSRVVKLDANGTLNQTFSTNLGLISTGIVHAVAIDTNDDIIVAGTFTKIGGADVFRIARLLSNGAVDPTFSVGKGADLQINSVAIQSDHKILVGGNFIKFSDTNKNKIVRLNSDGSIDTSFDIGAGFDGEVHVITLQPDGKILVGGNFALYKGLIANKIIRLHPDGSIDNSFISGTGFNNGIVYALTLDTHGNLMIGGSFTGNYNGAVVNRLVYLQTNGQIHPNFDIGSGTESYINAIATDNSDAWYCGGNFTTFDGLNQGRVSKINHLGVLEEGYLTANVGFNAVVLKAIPLSDKKILAGGSFKKFNGVTTGTLVRLDEEGALDSNFNLSQSGPDNTVRSVLVLPDDKIIVGGGFKNYNGIAHNRIIGLNANGSIDSNFNTGTGFNNQVYVITRQNDGKLIIGGNFTSYNGVSANAIIRLHSTGNRDASFNPLGADSYVEAVAIQPDGKIIVAGRFANFNGNSSSRIIRLNSDGSTDTTFNVGTGFNSNIYAIALQSDGKIVAGGAFTTYKGISQKRIIRLNSDGSLDATFAIGNGFSKGDVRTILLQKDGRLLVGGTFTGTYNGSTVSRIIRLHSDGTIDTSISTNLNGTLYSLAFTSDQKAIAAGNFNSVSGKAKHRIARLRLCTNSSTYSGTWSNETANEGMELTFNADYIFPASLNTCSCFIASGKTVTISEGQTLGLTFEYAGSGVLNIKNKGSLYQDDDEIVNTGIIHSDKITTPMKNYDYTYWSSPVIGQTAKLLSPNTLTSKYYIWDKEWIFDDGEMKAGKGYIIRVPTPGSYPNGERAFDLRATTYEQAVTFKGVPNNGIIKAETTSENNNYLVGNPYPSAIDGSAFLDKNPFLNGTIYLWTHDTPISKSGSMYVYDAADYTIYNKTGAVVAGPKGIMPTGKIASGQGFFVIANAAGTITFDNSMRLIEENNLFFKPKKTTKKESVKESKVWLNLTNEEGVFKQLLIGYCTDATNGYDSRFDAITLNGNSFVDFYSHSNTQKFAIQGRALPFEFSDEVPLGYSSKIKGKFTIAIANVEGMLKNEAVYLEDKMLNEFHDLTKEAYFFSTEIGTFNDRFVLRYQNNLSVAASKTIVPLIRISFNNQNIRVISENEEIQEIRIYDTAGKMLFRQNKINSTEYNWETKAITPQIILVKVKLSSNEVTVQKVIVH